MQTKTRVLHVLSGSAPVEEIVASLVTLADRRRFQPAVVSFSGPSGGSGIEAAGIPVIHFDKKPGLDLNVFPRLRQAFAEFQPHLVHTHGHALGYTWPMSSLNRPMAQVHTIHQAAQRGGRIGSWLQKCAFRGSVTPVAVAPAVAASFPRSHGLRLPITIPSGIPVRSFKSLPDSGEKWRIASGFALTDFLIACATPLIPQNGHKTLIDAFAKVASTGAKLLLAGDGPLEGEIRAQAKSLGLSKQVHLLGGHQDIPGLFAATDVVALASETGGTISLMKAMAAGKACVVASGGGLEELVEDNRSGILTKSGDVRDLSEALARLVDSPHLRARLGYAARERAVACFDHQMMVSAYESLYLKLLASKQLAA